MNTSIPLRQAGLVLVILLTATAALAQMSPLGGGMGGDMGHNSRRMRGSAKGDGSASSVTAELPAQQRFSELETKLKLNDAQRPFWNNYQDKVSALHADMMSAPSAAAVAKDDAVHQIDRQADLLRDRLAALEDIVDAARALYQSLTPEQKQVADKLLADTVPGIYDRFSRTQESNGKPGVGNREDSPPPSK